MKILAAIHPPEATAKILECLGLPSRAPPLAQRSPTSAARWTRSKNQVNTTQRIRVFPLPGKLL